MSYEARVAAAAEIYISRTPVHVQDSDGNQLWTRKQIARAFIAGNAAVISDDNQSDQPSPGITITGETVRGERSDLPPAHQAHIDQAVAVERERCARIAEGSAQRFDFQKALAENEDLEYGRNGARIDIARAIREGFSTPSPISLSVVAEPKRWLSEWTLPGGSIRWHVFEHEHQARTFQSGQPENRRVTALYDHPAPAEQMRGCETGVLTAEEITKEWGERCPELSADCPTCQMWAMHDEIERLRKVTPTDLLVGSEALKKSAVEMFAAIDSEQYISSETCDLINHFEREFDKAFPPEGGQ